MDKEEAIAISATRRSYKEMADGTLRVSIDVDPEYKRSFLDLFPEIDARLAVAPLKSEHELAKEKSKKGSSLPQQAAMLCKNSSFQEHALERCPAQHDNFDDAEKLAIWYVRDYCGIESRSELDTNSAAAARFKQLHREYSAWGNHGS